MHSQITATDAPSDWPTGEKEIRTPNRMRIPKCFHCSANWLRMHFDLFISWPVIVLLSFSLSFYFFIFRKWIRFFRRIHSDVPPVRCCWCSKRRIFDEFTLLTISINKTNIEITAMRLKLLVDRPPDRPPDRPTDRCNRLFHIIPSHTQPQRCDCALYTPESESQFYRRVHFNCKHTVHFFRSFSSPQYCTRHTRQSYGKLQ